MTNKVYTHLAQSNSETFATTQPNDLLFYAVDPQSKILIGSSNTSNYVSIAASSTSINNNLVASKDILPSTTKQSDIGSSSLRFNQAWINNVNISSNTITADTNQNLVMKTAGTGQFTVESATQISLNAPSTILQGSMIPSVNRGSDLGTPNLHFKEAWIDTVHISSNTLFLGDTPVLGTDADTITITADEDQSILVKTTGTGETNIQSVKGVNLVTNGLNSIVDVQASGAGGRVVFGATDQVTVTAPSMVVSSNMTVQGNLIVNGTNFTVNTQTVEVKDNIIVLNSGQVGSGVSAVTAGISIDRGDALDFQILFDENDDKFKIGPQGSLNAIATQNYVNTASLNTSNITSGILPVARGGTGTATSTGTGSVVLNASPTLTGNVGVHHIISSSPTGHVVLNTGSNATDVGHFWFRTSAMGANFPHTTHMLINGVSGNVGIGTTTPTEKLHVDGNILATGDVRAQSDARLKTDLQVIEDAMSKIRDINGYTYKMINEQDKRHVGLIAQELQAVLPEAVSEANDDAKTLSIAYGNVVALLVQGMKEQDACLAKMKAFCEKMGMQ
jgi:hypothetical protein